MKIKPKRVYGIRNKKGDTGTLVLLENNAKIEYWKENLKKLKRELKEDCEHFNMRLNAYQEVAKKQDPKERKEIDERIEANQKVLDTIKSKLAEMQELEIVTVTEINKENKIEKVCEITEFIPEWNEI